MRFRVHASTKPRDSPCFQHLERSYIGVRYRSSNERVSPLPVRDQQWLRTFWTGWSTPYERTVAGDGQWEMRGPRSRSTVVVRPRHGRMIAGAKNALVAKTTTCA